MNKRLSLIFLLAAPWVYMFFVSGMLWTLTGMLIVGLGTSFVAFVGKPASGPYE